MRDHPLRPQATHLPRHGLSVVEIMLAMAILAMAAVIFIPVFTQGVGMTREIRDYSVLVGLAEQLLHEHITRITNLAPGAPPINFFEDDITAAVKSAAQNEVLNSLPRAKILATVRPAAVCQSGGYEITIKMTWESGGRPKEFSLTTIKAVRNL
jgi:type II secretory pathway pseudopilin PulG